MLVNTLVYWKSTVDLIIVWVTCCLELRSAYTISPGAKTHRQPIAF